MPGTTLADYALTINAERARIEEQLAALLEVERALARYVSVTGGGAVERVGLPPTGEPPGDAQTRQDTAPDPGDGIMDGSASPCPQDADCGAQADGRSDANGSGAATAQDARTAPLPALGSASAQDAPRGVGEGPPAGDAVTPAQSDPEPSPRPGGLCERQGCGKAFAKRRRPGGQAQRYCSPACRRAANSKQQRKEHASCRLEAKRHDQQKDRSAKLQAAENGAETQGVRDAKAPVKRPFRAQYHADDPGSDEAALRPVSMPWQEREGAEL